jgi:hypothetical protein
MTCKQLIIILLFILIILVTILISIYSINNNYYRQDEIGKFGGGLIGKTTFNKLFDTKLNNISTMRDLNLLENRIINYTKESEYIGEVDRLELRKAVVLGTNQTPLSIVSNLNRLEITDINNEDLLNKIIYRKFEIESPIKDGVLTIPSNLSKIRPSQFRNKKIVSIIYEYSPNNSPLIFGEYSFANNQLQNLTIPPFVSKICRGAFLSCGIEYVDFEYRPPDEKTPCSYLYDCGTISYSTTLIIECAAFFNCKLNKLLIPSLNSLKK